MHKTIFIFILFFSCGLLLAQEQENYFPLAVGNKWEYIKPQLKVNRLIMTITRDTLMDNGKKYYIFDYNVPHTDLRYLKHFFTPIDPVRMDESGDLYIYDDSTQNEYLYLLFSKLDTNYMQYYPKSEPYYITSGCRYGVDIVKGDIGICSGSNPFIFASNIGMITTLYTLGDCWGTVWNPCEPFWNQTNVLVYAIIDGEKVYSIEESAEYLWYIQTEDVNTIPTNLQQIELHQNYPNPFNPETRIDFEIPKTEKVKLVIYNVLGKEIKTVLDDELHAGKYSTTWNGKDDQNNKVSSGIYFYRLTFGNNMQSITKKLTVLK